MKDIKELKSFEEILAERYHYRNTFSGRTKIVYHSTRRWIRSVIYSPVKLSGHTKEWLEGIVMQMCGMEIHIWLDKLQELCVP